MTSYTTFSIIKMLILVVPAQITRRYYATGYEYKLRWGIRMKDIDKDINLLSDGVEGVYKSRRFRKRICAIVLASIIALGVCTGVIIGVCNREVEPEPWGGKVIIITSSIGIYNEFFYKKQFPNLKNEFDMNQESFEKKANVAIYILGSNSCNQALEKIYGKKVDTSEWSLGMWNLVIVVDGEGSVVLECIEGEDKLIDALRDAGFQGEQSEEGD